MVAALARAVQGDDQAGAGVRVGRGERRGQANLDVGGGPGIEGDLDGEVGQRRRVGDRAALARQVAQAEQVQVGDAVVLVVHSVASTVSTKRTSALRRLSSPSAPVSFGPGSLNQPLSSSTPPPVDGVSRPMARPRSAISGSRVGRPVMARPAQGRCGGPSESPAARRRSLRDLRRSTSGRTGRRRPRRCTAEVAVSRVCQAKAMSASGQFSTTTAGPRGWSSVVAMPPAGRSGCR